MTCNNAWNTITIAAVAWMLAVAFAQFWIGVESPMGWLMVTVLALGPGLTVLYFAKDVPLTTSEVIRHARR